jgi:nucleotide-binding universal stress UspA family protein
MSLQRILVPVEYSENCRRALELAGEIAQQMNASIEVIHAWDHPKLVPQDLPVHAPNGEPRSLFELMGENAEREMGEFLASAKVPGGVKVTHRLENGEPCAAILAVIERDRPDLVVVGTHGRTGFRHFLMGSVAEKVVRFAPVPVLCVPLQHAPSHR